MRQSVLIVMALTALLGGCATTRGAGEPKDTAALEHVLEEWAAAWSSSQVEKLLPLFTDDARSDDPADGHPAGRPGDRIARAGPRALRLCLMTNEAAGAYVIAKPPPRPRTMATARSVAARSRPTRFRSRSGSSRTCRGH